MERKNCDCQRAKPEFHKTIEMSLELSRISKPRAANVAEVRFNFLFVNSSVKFLVECEISANVIRRVLVWGS